MRTINQCRACSSDKLEQILDLGEQHVSDFREDKSKTSKYPLVGVICTDCMLVQLKDTTPSQEMYHENYGFKSGVSDSIKNDLKEIVEVALSFNSTARKWLDIASNDGTLLSCVPRPIYRVGIDPIKKYCKEAEKHANRVVNAFFNASHFAEYSVGDGRADYEQFDIITSISCFYDMDDPNDFVAGVKKLMTDSSVWVIQQNYLLPTMELNAIDNFCHEHLEYYTLLSLENLLDRHDLEVIDVTTSMVNGGSLRTVVAKKGAHYVKKRVQEQRGIEAEKGLYMPETYHEFGERALKNVKKLREMLDNMVKAGKKVYILAASTRGATIWQAAGITEKLVPFAVERNPEKVGKYFSAIGIPIISEEQARKDKPDFMIIGPWFFADEIIDREIEYLKAGGELIQPLPELLIIKEGTWKANQ